MSSRARVLLLNAALGPLDYRVPHGMRVEHGSIVVAPLGPRQIIGVVWEEDRFPDVESVGDNRLRWRARGRSSNIGLPAPCPNG